MISIRPILSHHGNTLRLWRLRWWRATRTIASMPGHLPSDSLRPQQIPPTPYHLCQSSAGQAKSVTGHPDGLEACLVSNVFRQRWRSSIDTTTFQVSNMLKSSAMWLFRLDWGSALSSSEPELSPSWQFAQSHERYSISSYPSQDCKFALIDSLNMERFGQHLNTYSSFPETTAGNWPITTQKRLHSSK